MIGTRMQRNISRNLNVCLLSYRSNPHSGGQGVYLYYLSQALKELGHQVTIVSGPPFPKFTSGVKLHKLSGLDLYNPQNLFRTPSIKELLNPINLIEWIGVCSMGFPEPLTFGMRAYQFLYPRLNHFDVVHDNQSLSYGIWALSQHVPTVATIHHPISIDCRIAIKSTSSFWHKLKHLRWYSFISMQKRVARSLRSLITVSQAARTDICRQYKVPRSRFDVIPNGIDTAIFHPFPNIKREKNRIVVTNSADIPMKGLHILLKAVAMLAQLRDIKLVVVGAPKRNGTIEKLIHKLGLAGMVTFTGRIDDRKYVTEYARAAVAVVPSLYEGFGLPAGEAMACGTPVISTSGGALPEVVGDGGIIIPPADTKSLATAIARVLDHPRWAAQIGEAGRQRVNRLFTWKQAAQKTVSVYQKAINDYHRI